MMTKEATEKCSCGGTLEYIGSMRETDHLKCNKCGRGWQKIRSKKDVFDQQKPNTRDEKKEI
jgi:hypothetical protein